MYESPEAKVAANERCCGLEKISKSLSCCNYVGYNPNLHVCADVSHQQYGESYMIQDTRSLLRIFGPHMGHIKTMYI